jgi:hypothetical protein
VARAVENGVAAGEAAQQLKKKAHRVRTCLPEADRLIIIQKEYENKERNGRLEKSAVYATEADGLRCD